jgi:hypothetical protein
MSMVIPRIAFGRCGKHKKPKSGMGLAPIPSMADDWLSRMRRGDFAGAWKICDAARTRRAGTTCWDWPRHLQWVWSGEPLDGKRVLIRCYHGLGDTIQFIRYAPFVKRIASRVIVWAQPSLLPLLRGVAGIDEMLPLHDGAPEADYDVDIEVMELPHVFRTTMQTIPRKVPYLRVEGAPLRAPFAVGLVWRAGDWDDRRAVRLEQIMSLAGVPGVALYALQRDLAPGEGNAPFVVVAERDDPLGTARAMRSLDLVISVDSMPAHLAGALGVPVWTLLPAEADWRWMQDRDDSPWYPTMRLFRQSRVGAWEPVIERVARQLRRAARVAA